MRNTEKKFKIIEDWFFLCGFIGNSILIMFFYFFFDTTLPFFILSLILLFITAFFAKSVSKARGNQFVLRFKYNRAVKRLKEQEDIVKEYTQTPPLWWIYQNLWRLIHNRITEVSQKKFSDGYFSDAVESAFKEINNRVKKIVLDKTGKELDGVPLMQEAFSINNPIIEIEDQNTQTGRNIQKGYMFLFAGSISSFRNPPAHDNIELTKEQAMHQLVLSSLLMNKLDDIMVIKSKSLHISQ